MTAAKTTSPWDGFMCKKDGCPRKCIPCRRCAKIDAIGCEEHGRMVTVDGFCYCGRNCSSNPVCAKCRQSGTVRIPTCHDRFDGDGVQRWHSFCEDCAIATGEFVKINGVVRCNDCDAKERVELECPACKVVGKKRWYTCDKCAKKRCDACSARTVFDASPSNYLGGPCLSLAYHLTYCTECAEETTQRKIYSMLIVDHNKQCVEDSRRERQDREDLMRFRAAASHSS